MHFVEGKMRAVPSASMLGPRWLVPAAIAVMACLAWLLAPGMAGRHGVSALVMLSIFVSATLSNIAGFAFSAIAGGTVLHLVDDPVQAVKVLIVSSIAIQSYSVIMLWRTIRWRELLPFLLGGALTLPAGIYLLLNSPAAAYWQGMGAFLVVYALIMLFRKHPARYRGSTLIDAASGALGGITGGAAGFPGAFVTMWCAMRGLDKNRQRAVYQPYILAMQLMAMCGLDFAGRAQSYDVSLLQYAPAALLGAYCGLVIFKQLNDRYFSIAVYLLLMLSGLTLIAK